MNHEEAQSLIRRHFEAGLCQDDWPALRDHIRGCPDCKQSFDAAAKVEALISGGDLLSQPRLDRLAQLGSPDVSVRALPNFSRRATRWVAPLLAAAALLLAVGTWRPKVEPQMMARGDGQTSRAAWITPYVKDADGNVQRMQEDLHKDQAMLFAYSNLAGSAQRHLVIVGLDAQGRAHWYHPAWLDPKDPPEAVEVKPGEVDVEIPEAVRADHAMGPLTICGLFFEDAPSVPELDHRIEAEGWPEAGSKDCYTVQVRP